LGAIVVPAYKLLFGWLDRRLASKNQERLAAEIRLVLPFLFTEGHGEIAPNEGVPFPPPFDYAFVTVSFDRFLLRFARGRGELTIGVAPVFAPTEWHDLSLILGLMENSTDFTRRSFRDLSEVSKTLRPRWQEIGRFLSVEQFKNAKDRLETEVYIPEKNRMREWEAEINWRLYGNKK
jgi:hypothetical protein